MSVDSSRDVGKLFGSYDGSIRQEKSDNYNVDIRQNRIQRFIENYICQYVINSFCDIKENDFDAIVVGSDQIWRPRYIENNFHSEVADAFLKFTQGWKIKRVAYSASFGEEFWEYSSKDTEECKKYISKFDAVSVREDSGVILCRDYLGYDKAINLIDPTLLLKLDDYIYLIKDMPRLQSHLVAYILDSSEEKFRLVDSIAKEKHLIPIYVNQSSITLPSVEKWLQLFRDADYVVTDSFHACVFSVIFGKEFVALGNKERGLARFESLLRTLNLEDRIFYSTADYSSKEIKSSIKNAQIKVESLREIAFRFLSQNLK